MAGINVHVTLGSYVRSQCNISCIYPCILIAVRLSKDNRYLLEGLGARTFIMEVLVLFIGSW